MHSRTARSRSSLPKRRCCQSTWILSTCLLVNVMWSTFAFAQQAQCWMVTYGGYSAGNQKTWTGEAPTFEAAAAALLAEDQDCWSDGKGGCLALQVGYCNPSGAPSASATGSMCRVISSQDQSFYFSENFSAKNLGCAYWVQAQPPPAAETCSANCVGDPINPAMGNVYRREEDLAIAGPPGSIAFRRFYNSADSTGSDMGPGWRHSYDRFITINYLPAVPTIYPGQSPTVSATYSDPATACVSGFSAVQFQINGWQDATASYANNTCVITTSAGNVGTIPIYSASEPSPASSPVEYDVVRDDGQVIRYTTQNGIINTPPGISLRFAQTSNGFTLTDDDDTVETYNANGVLQSITRRSGVVQTLSYDSQGHLSSVTDSFGHSLAIGRTNGGQIASITISDGGGTVQYSYDGASRLSQVTNSDNTTQTYLYENITGQQLSGVQDESGTRVSTWGYDSQGRATSSTEADGADATSLVYNSDGSVTTTDALGTARTFTFGRHGDLALVTGISGSQCPTCSDSKSTAYDLAGYPSSRTDYNGNITLYTYDDSRGLEISRTEAAGSADARTITTQWKSAYRLPTLISVYTGDTASGTPVRTTSFSYDSSGNLLTKTVTDPATGVSRTWTYTYDSYGHVLTAKGPRTDANDTTTYTYYDCTTGYQCGHVETVTDALSQTTTYNSYDAYGRPLTITDPNGTVTTLSYDARGRLTSRSVAGETASFSYYPTGLLEQVTLPDGSTLSYGYDAAHRWVQVSDGFGDKIVYTLDAMGNRLAENSYDPSGALFRTHTRVINQLDEVYQEINAAGTPAVTTTFGYDSEGNQTSIAAPLNENTTESYDALNRLAKIEDPASGVTSLSYDADDDLTSVTDPRTLTTSYGYDGFGDLSSQASPDTGTTTDTYDSGGNLATSTDARGAVATYGYDALNRVTSTAYSLGGNTDQTLSFTYDQGTDGIGHLTGASDANHSMSWSYDPQGRVTQMTQTVGGFAKSVQYGYTNGDLTTLTTPSGQMIGYQYSNHRISAITVNGSPLVSGVTYAPFGSVTGWQWASGSTVSRTYDGDGQVTSSTTGGYTASYSYYADGTLESATEDAPAVYSTSSGATTVAVASGSNQITSLSGAASGSYQYDAAGDLLSDGTRTFTYDDGGRLASATDGGTTTTYRYNALGERIEKSSSNGTTYFVYDEAGHLLGEYDAGGNLIEELVWLNDTPVASLRPNPSGSGIEILYIDTDFLNAPTALASATSGKVVWRWDHDPYGNGAALEDPSDTGTDTVFNLRFPGQYYDQETGLIHNGFRDYDPTVGRYVESDPMGLLGGSNSTYAYASGNPVSNVDPDGLQVATGAAIGTAVEPGLGTIAGAAIGIGIGLGIGAVVANSYVNNPEAQAEYEAYKDAYAQPPPPDLDECELLKWQLQREQNLLQARQAWDAKWSPGRHAVANAQSQRAINNIKDKMKKAGCTCP